MFKKLTVLFVPMEAHGHYNACIGIAGSLRDRGHKVVFAVHDDWKNKLTSQGFIEEWYTPTEVENDSKKQDDAWGELVAQMTPALSMPIEEKVKYLYLPIYQEAIRQVKQISSRLREIVANVKPDVIIVDFVLHLPAVMNSGIPWILSISLSPSIISTFSTNNVPPPYSGCPTNIKSKDDWERYTKVFDSTFIDEFNNFKDWVISEGGPILEYNGARFYEPSSFANIYKCPVELDYTEFRPIPPKFHRFDGFIRNCDDNFEIPDNLKNKPGKLIYFSMGTIGCSDIVLMKRLISFFAKSPHGYIISKGPMADKIELADNMWGKASVPQLKVLPLVDLVITHGGNNTVTESFYFGKPLIVLPLFIDQPDNAQRIKETGLGYRFDPYKVTESELNSAIEKLLSDKDIQERMEDISRRIQAANNLSKVADLVEKVAKENNIN